MTFASLVAVGLVVVAPGTARANPATESNTVRTAHIASADIARVSHRADAVGIALTSKLRSQESSRVTDFLDGRARAGHLLRKTDVQVATIANPLSSGHDITVVWSGSTAPGDIKLQAIGDDENGASGLGIEFDPDGSAETLDGAPAQLAGGSGYDAGVSPKNMYKYSNGCHNAYWDATYSSTDYHVESCWEKWAQSGTNHWVYNRWGLFTRPDSSASSPDIRDFTIRSRPWKVDLNHASSFVSKLNSWQPTGPTQTCTSRTATLGGTYNGVTANIGIPIQTCSTSILHIDTGQKMIGIGVEGHEPTGRQIRVDVGGDYNATNSTAVPIWADYAWATVSYVLGPNGCCSGNDEYVLKDSGW